MTAAIIRTALHRRTSPGPPIAGNQIQWNHPLLWGGFGQAKTYLWRANARFRFNVDDYTCENFPPHTGSLQGRFRTNSGGVFSAGYYGPDYSCVDGTSGNLVYTNNVINLSSYSNVFILLNGISSGRTYPVVLAEMGTNTYRWYIDTDGSMVFWDKDGLTYTSTFLLQPYTPYSLGLRYRLGTLAGRQLTMFVNGVAVYHTDAFNSGYLGDWDRLFRGSTVTSASGRFAMAILHYRDTPDTWHAELHRNPWQIFSSNRPKYFSLPLEEKRSIAIRTSKTAAMYQQAANRNVLNAGNYFTQISDAIISLHAFRTPELKTETSPSNSYLNNNSKTIMDVGTTRWGAMRCLGSDNTSITRNHYKYYLPNIAGLWGRRGGTVAVVGSYATPSAWGMVKFHYGAQLHNSQVNNWVFIPTNMSGEADFALGFEICSRSGYWQQFHTLHTGDIKNHVVYQLTRWDYGWGDTYMHTLEFRHYINGVNKSSYWTNSNSSWVYDDNEGDKHLYIGFHSANSGSFHDAPYRMGLIVVSKRPWSAYEAKGYNENPWQVFSTQRPTFYSLPSRPILRQTAARIR